MAGAALGRMGQLCQGLSKQALSVAVQLGLREAQQSWSEELILHWVCVARIWQLGLQGWLLGEAAQASPVSDRANASGEEGSGGGKAFGHLAFISHAPAWLRLAINREKDE